MQSTSNLRLRQVTSAVGAVIEGVDLRKPLSLDAVSFIDQALADHGVVFFHGQDLNAEQMEVFVTNFGTPIPEPFMQSDGPREPVMEANLLGAKRTTSVWHTDTTFIPGPPSLTALRAVKLPPVGGDTCWSSMYAAYESLSEPFRCMLDGLTAVHSMLPVLERMGGLAIPRGETNRKMHGVDHVHPVIRVHPQTGRKALFVNEGWTTRIVELTPAESKRVLALLFEHVKSPDFMMRWRWAPNDLAVWDNRSVQHYAVPDYDSERIMQRVVLAGDVPRGPEKAP